MATLDSPQARLDHQTWLIDTGHGILEKKRGQGYDALTPLERLIHSLWIVDYSMRNAGDLATAHDLDPHFLSRGQGAALLLDLPFATSIFATSEGELERRYFDVFDDLCAEIRHR